MPPLIHAALCWILGAFVGSAELTRHLPFLSVLALSAAIGIGQALVVAVYTPAYARRRGRAHTLLVALAAIAMAATAHARASASRMAQCRVGLHAVIARGDTIAAVFDDPVAPRARSRGVASGRGTLAACRVPIMARFTEGRAAAGVWVSVAGHGFATNTGLRLDEASVTASASTRRDWRREARARTGAIIDRDFGRNAPLVRALLIADQDGIAPDVRDRFADAGLVHLLSISGLHVAIIAGALLTLAGALRLSRTLAFLAAMTVIMVYVAALGAPPPAVRSAVMLGVVGIAERLQRPTHPWTALALGAVLPALEPAVVLDLGWQLSVSGMAALVAARALWRRVRLLHRRDVTPRVRPALAWLQRLEGWKSTAAREVVTGTVATLVTAPLIAWTFGRISVIAPFSNLLAGPLVTFVQPALFLALLASPWPSLARLIADATAPPLAMLDAVAHGAAHIPGATLRVAPTALGALATGAASAAFVRATASRHWTRGLLVASGALTVAIWAPMRLTGSGRLELHLLDVGQGDAIALRTPRGRWMLVDAGRRWDGGDAGRRTVVPYVRTYGGPIAAFIMSHAHDDHVGGAASVVAALAPADWWESAVVTRSAAYGGALTAVRDTHGRWHRGHPGDRWMLDGVEVRVLAPDSAWTAAQHDANETSVVLRIAYGQVAFLLTGDAEAAEEQWMLQHTDPDLLRADILKLGHHGSRTSSTGPFVDAVAPRLGLVSVGAGNRYGHPSPQTLETFAARGVPLLRTDQEGTVVVETDGRVIAVRTGGERWMLPERGTALAPPDP